MEAQELAQQMLDEVQQLLVPFINSGSNDFDTFENIRNRIHIAGRDRSSLINGCCYGASKTVENINFG